MPDFAVTTAFTVKEQLTQFFANGEKAATRFETMVGGAFKRSGHEASLFKSILGGVTLGNLASKGVEKLGDSIKDTVKQIPEFADKAEAIGRMSMMTGMAAEQYQRLQYAAHMSDIEAGTLDSSLKKMNVSLGQLAHHQGNIETGLKRVDPRLLAQLKTARSSSDAFLLVADAMAKTSSAQQRAAISTAVFGKQGQELLPMLLQGRKGLSELMGEADKYGSVLSGSAIEAGGALSDSLKKLNGSTAAIKDTVLSSLVTAVGPYVEKAAEWVSANRDLIATKVGTFVTDFAGAVKAAVPLVRDLYSFVKEWGPAIFGAAVAFNVLKYGMLGVAAAGKIFALVNNVIFAFQAYAGGAATAQEALNMVMSANPIGLIVTGVALLIGGFIALSNKMGGVENAAKFLGQAFLKALLIPVNLIIGQVELLLLVLSKIPGLGSKITPALSAVQNFQNGMNKTLTGSAGMLDFKSTYENNLSADRKAARQAPNQAAVDRQASTFSGLLQIQGAPAGSKLSSSSSGPAALRTELMGANP